MSPGVAIKTSGYSKNISERCWDDQYFAFAGKPRSRLKLRNQFEKGGWFWPVSVVGIGKSVDHFALAHCALHVHASCLADSCDVSRGDGQLPGFVSVHEGKIHEGTAVDLLLIFRYAIRESEELGNFASSIAE